MRVEKQRLRASLLRRREALLPAELSDCNRLIQERVLGFAPYLAAGGVALYSPVGHEAATERIRDHALKAGKRLFYPRVGDGEELNFVRVESAAELAPGRYGILEPRGGRVMAQSECEGLIVFVPGVAFDLNGNRLGRGKGGYDRLLSRLGGETRLVGLAYEFQILAELPSEPWDQKVHHVITERRVVDCGDRVSRSSPVS